MYTTTQMKPLLCSKRFLQILDSGGAQRINDVVNHRNVWADFHISKEITGRAGAACNESVETVMKCTICRYYVAHLLRRFYFTGDPQFCIRRKTVFMCQMQKIAFLQNA